MPPSAYILLAEDSDDDSYFARRCFSTAGINVEIRRALNGIDVCKVLTEAGADLPAAIILDIKMPMMDGFETLRWIRENSAFKQIPVVILSSSDMIEDRRRARELGCTEYLVKPNSLTKLQELVNALAARLSIAARPRAVPPEKLRPSA